MKVVLLLLFLNLVYSFNLFLIDNLPTIKEIVHTIPYNTRADIVECASGILPKVDFFGSLVLETNEKIIDKILYLDFLTEEQTKMIILKIIEISKPTYIAIFL